MPTSVTLTTVGGINSSVQSFTVSETTVFGDTYSGSGTVATGFRIKIDSEIMLVGAVTRATETLSSVTRGYEGTTAASHSQNAVVTKLGDFSFEQPPNTTTGWQTALWGFEDVHGPGNFKPPPIANFERMKEITDLSHTGDGVKRSARHGTYLARFTLGPNDDSPQGNQRMRLLKAGFHLDGVIQTSDARPGATDPFTETMGDDYWYGFSALVPAGQVPPTSWGSIVELGTGSADSNAVGHLIAPIIIGYQEHPTLGVGCYYARVSGGENKFGYRGFQGSWENGRDSGYLYLTSDANEGYWTDFLYHIIWSRDSAVGKFELWWKREDSPACRAAFPAGPFAFTDSNSKIWPPAGEPTNAANMAWSNNEVQRLTFSAVPTGGTFSLVVNGQNVTGVAHNAAASVIETAIRTAVGGAFVSVRQETGTAPKFLVFFHGPVGGFRNTSLSPITVSAQPTGATISVTTLRDGTSSYYCSDRTLHMFGFYRASQANGENTPTTTIYLDGYRREASQAAIESGFPAASGAPPDFPIAPDTTGLFGQTTATTFASSELTANLKRASRFELLEEADVTKLVALVKSNSSITGTQVAKAVIYSDSAGAPNALVGEGSEVTIADGASAAWTDFPCVVTLQPGWYWLGLHTGTTNLAALLYRSAVDPLVADATNTHQYLSDTYAGGAATPWGTPVANPPDYSLAIYAKYTAVVATTTALTALTGGGSSTGTAELDLFRFAGTPVWKPTPQPRGYHYESLPDGSEGQRLVWVTDHFEYDPNPPGGGS